MKTNAIISALCVVGIIGAFANDGALIQRGRTDGPPEEPVVPGAIPIQKVVYWSDIPGMKWNWTTQVTNKPSIPTVGTLNTTATSAQSTSASESLSGNITLHKIAKTGAYSDLSGTPTIPTVGTLNTTLTTAQATSANESLSGTIKLHKVSKTGNLEDLSGTSLTIGNVEAKYVKIKQTGEIEVFDDFGDSVVYKLNLPNKNGHLAVLSDIPSTNGLAAKSYVDSHQWTWASITNKPSFATVATSGSYNDLSDKPSIPAAQVNADWNANSGVAQILNKPTLATVATSGSYNDLSNKPNVALADHTHSNLVNGSTKVIANENGTMTISKGDGSSVYYSVTGTYDQYNPRAIAKTDMSNYSEFSPSVSYTGYSDPVLYNGALYGCLTTHTGPWDESHFRLLVPADKVGFHIRITTATPLSLLERNQTTTAHIDVVWFLSLVGGATQWQEHTLISYDAMVQYYGTAEGKKTFGVYNQSNVVYGEDYNGSSSGLGGVSMLASSTYYIMDHSPGGINRIDFVGGPIAWGDNRFGWNNYLVADESFTKTVATVDQISSLDNKMDKVFNPTAGHIVTVTDTGSLIDFGESPWGIRGDWNETDQSDVNYILNKPTNVSVFNNDAGYVKTNAQGTLVVGSNQMQPNGGSWSLVMGSGGSHSKSDNTLILSPGSSIGTNSQYSAVFGPGAYIHDNAQYSFAFGGGVNIQDNCNDSFVVGSGAQSAHKCAFLWSANSNGGKSIPAQPITHGNGTFNINTYDGVAGVYIGDTNLQQIIRLEAKAMIRDAVSQVNVNLQSAEDTRAALTNLITILKNL